MIWLTERQSRYLIPVTMPDGYDADAVLAGLIEGLDTVPAHLRRSLTFDCGSEWANWRRLAGHYDLQVWFCDPHSPWQRGQIENQNRQVRWWFPRGTDLRLVTAAQAQHAAAIINHQRRRSSTTKAQQNSMLPSPCSDHWNWPLLAMCQHANVANTWLRCQQS